VALAVVWLAGCQFASAPPSVAPSATAGRSASAASSPTPPRPPASSTPVPPTALPRTPTPQPVRSPTGPAAPVAPTRTPALAARSTSAAPTLGRAGAPSATPGRGADAGALLPGTQARLTGDVTQFAASARVMEVQVDGGGRRQVSLSPSATIRRADGSTGSAADLRPGQRVQATGRVSGDAGLIADEVLLLAPR